LVTVEAYVIWPEPADFLDRAGKRLRYPFWGNEISSFARRYNLLPQNRVNELEPSSNPSDYADNCRPEATASGFTEQLCV
jgi:hypothetical protein